MTQIPIFGRAMKALAKVEEASFPRYRPLANPPLHLTLRPQLESWMAKDHPDQRRLRAFLDQFELDLGQASTPPAPLAFELTVLIPPTSSPLRGGSDLDNFLTPILRRLDPEHSKFRSDLLGALQASGYSI
jgi:hypothetical protein